MDPFVLINTTNKRGDLKDKFVLLPARYSKYSCGFLQLYHPIKKLLAVLAKLSPNQLIPHLFNGYKTQEISNKHQ